MNMQDVYFHNAAVFNGFSMIKNGAVLVRNGRIAAVFDKDQAKRQHFENVRMIDLGGACLAPGFIDTHIHGIEGFGTTDGKAESILGMSESLVKYGTTAFLPTISRETPDKAEIFSEIRAVVGAMGRETGAKVMGVHLEGPFLSPAKKGAQPDRGIIPIDMDLMKELWDVSEGHIVSMTAAPELDGIFDLADFCTEKGIVLQAGHTNATYARIFDAMQHGVRHATHMFNAMTGMHHREPGAAGAVLRHDEMSCEIVADGYHVNPVVVNILAKCKPEDKLVLITDLPKQGKMNVKTFVAAGVEYGLGDYFYKTADGTLMGSNISMIDGVKNLILFGLSPERALKAASANPAKILNLGKRGILAPGYEADLAVFDSDFEMLYTVIGGDIRKTETRGW